MLKWGRASPYDGMIHLLRALLVIKEARHSTAYLPGLIYARVSICIIRCASSTRGEIKYSLVTVGGL